MKRDSLLRTFKVLLLLSLGRDESFIYFFGYVLTAFVRKRIGKTSVALMMIYARSERRRPAHGPISGSLSGSTRPEEENTDDSSRRFKQRDRSLHGSV